ncbi:MAG: hypothetical protein IH630_06905 [Thermoplasmata archaeon]|nr:hypothetical protein [Thermoplasmata archaeon]TFG70955.1 MAG: hypothetical protein E4H25_00535 [Methanomassiliicoccus sp.]
MEEKAKGTTEKCCASCGFPIPPDAETCPKCSQVRTAKKRPVKRNSEDSRGLVSVIRTPEESVRRSVASGMLTREQGELLLLLLSRGRLLDPEIRSVSTSLVKELAEHWDVMKREDKAYILRKLVDTTTPSEGLARELSRAFKTG